VPAADESAMRSAAMHAAAARWLATRTRKQLDAIGARHDIPLCTLRH